MRNWNHNHSNVYYNIVGLLQDHPKKAFTTKWHGHCHRDQQTWWSQFHVRFSISGSTRPNLQVAVTHVGQRYSQHSFELPLGMNGIHRMQSGHAYEPFSKSVNYVPPYMQRTTTVLVNGIPNQYNYGIKISEKKKMIVLQGLNVRLVQCLLLFQFYTLSALHKEQAIPCCLIHRLKELELLQEDRRPKQKCKSLAEKNELNVLVVLIF